MITLKDKQDETKIMQVYAPKTRSPDEEKESFQIEIEINIQGVKIIMKDFNAQVGLIEVDMYGGYASEVWGVFGYGRRNEEGRILLDM